MVVMLLTLLTFILSIVSIPSPPHSFIPGLKPSFSPNPSHCSLPFLLQDWLRGFPGLFTDTSEHIRFFKGEGSPYSITVRRVPELIPVLGSQPAGDVSHKPGGRLPLLFARPAVTPATFKRAATNFAADVFHFLVFLFSTFLVVSCGRVSWLMSAFEHTLK